MHSIAQSQVHNLQSQIQSLLQQQNVQVQAQTVHQNVPQNVSVIFAKKKNALQELIYNFLLGVAKFGSKRAKPRSEFRSKCSGAKRGAKFSSKYGLAEFSSATKYESERVIAKCRFSKYDPGN